VKKTSRYEENRQKKTGELREVVVDGGKEEPDEEHAQSWFSIEVYFDIIDYYDTLS